MLITSSSSLMAIARNSNMRVSDRVDAIKNSDGDENISSVDEANAILAIPYEDLKWLDNAQGLMVEKLYAKNYLKNGGRCWRDDIPDIYKHIKQKAKPLLNSFMKFLALLPPMQNLH